MRRHGSDVLYKYRFRTDIKLNAGLSVEGLLRALIAALPSTSMPDKVSVFSRYFVFIIAASSC
jgi:hypothetical protein